MASFRFDKAKEAFLLGTLGDLTTSTLKVALFTSLASPDQATAQYFSDVTHEVTGTGYTAGGITLTAAAVHLDALNHACRLTASTPTWANASFTARYACVYQYSGSSATSPLLAWIDFGTDQTVSIETFSVSWDPTFGVFYIG